MGASPFLFFGICSGGQSSQKRPSSVNRRLPAPSVRRFDVSLLPLLASAQIAPQTQAGVARTGEYGTVEDKGNATYSAGST